MKIVDQTCGIENSVKNQHKYEKVGMKNEISLMCKTKGTKEKWREQAQNELLVFNFIGIDLRSWLIDLINQLGLIKIRPSHCRTLCRS